MRRIYSSDHFCISPSQMKTLDCEVKWGLEYGGLFKDITGYNRDELPKPDFSVFGSWMHSMFRLFFKTNYASAESFSNAGEGPWWMMLDRTRMFQITRNSVGYYLNRGLATLASFYNDMTGQRNISNQALEIERVATVRSGRYMIGLKGKMDRIREDSGEVIVTDYKTTLRRENEETLARDMQFMTYNYLIHKLQGREAVVEVHFPGFEAGERTLPTKIIPLHFTEDDRQNLVRTLEEVGDRRNDVISRLNTGQLKPNYTPKCVVCSMSYSGVCDAYTGNNRFADQRFSVHEPAHRFPVRRKKLEGQRRFYWARKTWIDTPFPPRNQEQKLF